MKKKLLSLFLALITVLTLAACGKEEASAETTIPHHEVLTEVLPTDATDPQGPEETREIDPLVVVDNEYIRITATGKYAMNDPFRGFIVGYNVLIENKTQFYIHLSLRNESMDGFMLDPAASPPEFSTASLSPGKKANTTIRIIPEHERAVKLESIDDLVNFEGTVTVATNTDGSNHYQNAGAFPFLCPIP